MNKSPNTTLLRLRPRDTPTGVSAHTVDALMAATGLPKGDLIHLALRQFADRTLAYPADDGPLTSAELDAIEAHSPASRIPDDQFESLF